MPDADRDVLPDRVSTGQWKCLVVLLLGIGFGTCALIGMEILMKPPEPKREAPVTLNLDVELVYHTHELSIGVEMPQALGQSDMELVDRAAQVFDLAEDRFSER